MVQENSYTLSHFDMNFYFSSLYKFELDHNASILISGLKDSRMKSIALETKYYVQN